MDLWGFQVGDSHILASDFRIHDALSVRALLPVFAILCQCGVGISYDTPAVKIIICTIQPHRLKA